MTDSQDEVGFTLDFEVLETRVQVDRSLGERFAVHGELAYRGLSAGSLDSLVATWLSVKLPTGRAADLTVQLEANSAVLDTGFDEFDGAAIVLTFGGSYRMAAASQFDVGISEDIDADTSPDIVFNLGVRHAF